MLARISLLVGSFAAMCDSFQKRSEESRSQQKQESASGAGIGSDTLTLVAMGRIMRRMVSRVQPPGDRNLP